MASLNKKTQIYTEEGAVAKKLTIQQQLERTVMSCMLWEDTFYESGVSVAERIKDLCTQLNTSDILDLAVKTKEDMRLRHTPLLLVREAFRQKERKSCGDVLERLITRPDDITEFLAIYRQERKEPIAKQAKLALGRAFHKFDEYQLAKYNGGNKDIKLATALRLVHPEPSEILGKLRRGELATPSTWEVELSKCGDKKETWSKLLQEEKLGGLALLRNIRNMTEAGIDDESIKKAIKNIKTGKLLPINFIASGLYNPRFEAEIEAKLLECFTKDKVEGKTIVLVDVSGSMYDPLSTKSKMKRSDVAASLAIIARETFSDISLFSFSDDIYQLPARRGFAIKDCLDLAPHHGTRLGKTVSYLVEKESFDRLIIITDEQSSDPIPDFKGYMINVASNKHGIGYGKCVHIDGWSDKVIDYIVEYEQR